MVDPNVLALIPRINELDVLDVESNTQEWYDARFAGIGGSEIAGILRISPWENSTPLAIFKAKRERLVTPPNWNMKQGSAMEPITADAWAEAEGYTVYKVPMLIDKEKPWRRVNLDRIGVPIFGGSPRVVEIKWTTSQKPWATIPKEYFVQVIWQMYLTGLHETAYLVYSKPHQAPDFFPVDYDAELAEQIGEAVDRFWLDHVQANIEPPPMTPNEIIEDAVKRAIAKVVVDSTVEIDAIARKIQQSKIESKRLDTEIKSLTAKIADFMASQSAQKVKGSDYTISAITKRGNISYKSIVDELNWPKEKLEQYRGTESRFITCRFKGESDE